MLSLAHRSTRLRVPSQLLAVCAFAAAALDACSSKDDGAPGPASDAGADQSALPDDKTAPSVPIGSRRITLHELNQVLRDVLKDEVGVPTTRIEDTSTGFDNDINGQPLASAAYIDDTETVATDAAARFVANKDAWAAIVPCTPSGAADEACLRQLIARGASAFAAHATGGRHRSLRRCSQAVCRREERLQGAVAATGRAFRSSRSASSFARTSEVSASTRRS
jgi:hypothetical protein